MRRDEFRCVAASSSYRPAGDKQQPLVVCRNRFVWGHNDAASALPGDFFAFVDEIRKQSDIVVAFCEEIFSHRADLVDFRGRFHG